MTKRPRVTIGALVFNQQGELLLLKSPKWNNKYIVPGGHVEFGEKLADTVKREVKEETGLEVNNIQFLKVLELIQSDEYYDPNTHFVCIQFTCNAKSTEIVLNDEAEEYIWEHCLFNPKNK